MPVAAHLLREVVRPHGAGHDVSVGDGAEPRKSDSRLATNFRGNVANFSKNIVSLILTVQYYSHRTFIDDLHRHPRAEASGLDRHP